jgi:hypothetical protein
MQHLDDGSLQAWLDRERSDLAEADIEAVDLHLEGCAECAARAEELDALTHRTATLLAGHVGDSTVPAYGDAVRRARTLGLSRRSRGWGASAWAASVAVALGAGWLGNELYRARPEPVVTPGMEASEAEAAPPSPGAAISDDAAPQAAPPAAITAEPRDPVVRGRVIDAQSGQPIQAAQVYIADLDVGVLTLQDGSFRLPLLEQDVDEGPLTLTVQRIGYRTEYRDFTASAGDTVFVDFRVQEEALTLDEIIVTGTTGGTQRRAVGNTVPPASPATPATIRISSADPALADGGAWSTRAPAEAQAAVDFSIAMVPGLDVTSVEVGRLGGADAVRVRQSLGAGGTLTLLETRAPLALDGAATLDGRTVSTTRRGDVAIVGAAALPVDSLTALLARVR